MDESRASNLRDFDSLSGEAALGSDPLANLDGNGEPLFVINLCAAMTPIDLQSQALAGLSQYKLYQVSRMEDGRRRYRLRLGFFTTEADAENVLSSLRGRYATAFTACLCEEDLKHATGYLKCSVKDLERTGRYTVLKLRGDSGATTTIRALDPAMMQTQSLETTAVRPVVVHPVISEPQKPVAKATVLPIRPAPSAPRAPETSKLAPRLLEDLVVETSWQPGAPAQKAAPSKPAAQATAPQPTAPKANLQPLAPQPAAPAQSPKRQSLMRQAHAMAPMDAAERAKAVPGNSASAFVDHLATGKFKLQQAQAAQQAAHSQTQPQAAQPRTTQPHSAAQAPKAPPAPHTPAQAQRSGSQANVSATNNVGKPAQAPPLAAKPASPAPSKVAANTAHNAPIRSQSNTAKTGTNVAPNISLDAQIPPAHTAAAPIQKANQAFHVGAGANIPETTLSLAPSTATSQPAPTQIARVIAPVKEASTTDDLLRARELAKQSMQWRQDNGEVPTLDSTQTIRTLTKGELEDENRPKWFAVQLAISDQPVNLDMMPKLDIFDAYSLYSVAAMEGNSIRHTFRLGFFREEVSAMAVMGYLKTFFSEPVIVRIPDAEHDRFVDAPKMSAIAKPSANHVMLDEKHAAKHVPVADLVPTISSAVERTASMSKQSGSPMAKSAPPATKRGPATAAGKKPAINAAKMGQTGQHDMLDEASLLGLTDTQILRVRKNPSLLSRLLGK